MAYADFSGKIITHRYMPFRMTLAEAVVAGDLVSKDGYLADADAARPAYCVACETDAAAAVIWVTRKAEVKKPPTIATGGGVSAGAHGGTAGYTLFLSTTAGDAKETPDGDGIGQVVGLVLSTDRVLLEPSDEIDYLMELEAADYTLDIEDIGKVCYVNTDAVVITLPAVATGHEFEVVNCAQNGAAKVSVDPNSADEIKGPDIAGAANKDIINTKATAMCMDRVRVAYESADGYAITSVKGIWAAEA